MTVDRLSVHKTSRSAEHYTPAHPEVRIIQ